MVDTGERFPVDYIITEVASNVMLMTIFALCLFAQWAVYAGKRGDRAHAALALAVVALMAIAFINGQAFVWHTMEVPIKENYYGALFYAMTGTMTLLVVLGLVFTVVAAFRTLGRNASATPRSCPPTPSTGTGPPLPTRAVWLVVYVTK